MAQQIRLVAVDDHPMFLEGLRRAVEQTDDLVLVGEGCSAEEACRLAEDKQFDVLLLDIGIPGNGLSAVRTIMKKSPQLKIVMLTASDSDEHVAEALAVGAKGYLLKGAGAMEVLDAVRLVQEGVPYVSPAVASRLLIQKVVAERSQKGRSPIPKTVLSDREQRVVDCASQGLTNKEIAERLNLSVRTVKRQMSIILQKLHVRSRLAVAVAKLNSH